MDDRRWRRVKSILDEASRLAHEARAPYLERACADDPALCEEVSSLLAFHDQTRDPLGRPIFDVNAEDPRVGRRLGHYRIARLLGRGGMGKVYLGIREDDYSKRVAIKLIQQGLDAEQRARFHEERQILADLDHPSIARLIDGGTTDDALPYLVMELVEGESIERYCDLRGLGVRERLELFGQVLEAVDFSHRHLVVHCDLKPGHVLVTADGGVKLIDFGIAKLLREERAETTRPGPLSPRYASPEQIGGGPVTTATDVYSLGVLLYELLAGRHPYLSGEEDLVQTVCETTPLAPSAVVRAPPPVEAMPCPEDVARARGTTVRKLERRLAGDVDAIVMKAMRKHPRERYGSAAELADDVRRHLSGHPVVARAGSPLYRLGKLVRRERLRLAAAILAFVALGSIVAGVVLRARVARERAAAAAIGGFVEDLFRAADPDRADGEDLSVRELLDRGRDRLGTGLDDHPLVRSELLTVVGRVYQKLGDLDQAERLLRESLAIQQRYDPDNDVILAGRLNELGAVLRQKNDLDGAEALYRQALERIGGCRSEPVDAVYIASNLAVALTEKGEHAEAEEVLGCLLARDFSQADAPIRASVLNKVGHLRYRQGRLEEAEERFREVLALREAYHGPLHTDVGNALNNLGAVLHERGKGEEARAVLGRALEVRRKLLAEDHPHVAGTEKHLARVLLALGDVETAEALARHAVEVLQDKLGSGDPRVTEAESVLEQCLIASEAVGNL